MYTEGEKADILHGITVVVTRSTEESKATALKVMSLGGMPLIAPLIKVHFLAEDLGATGVGVIEISRYHGIIATSANAVRGLQRWLGLHAELNSPDFLPPIFAVGQATLRTAEELGWSAQLFPDVKDSLGLAYALVNSFDKVPPHAHFLWPRGQMADTRWVPVLEQAGYKVQDVFVYRTDLSPWSLKLRNHLLTIPRLVVLLFSPSAVFSLQQSDTGGLLRTKSGTLFACIGNTTLRSAQDGGLREVVVAKHPTDSELLQAVSEAIQRGF